MSEQCPPATFLSLAARCDKMEQYERHSLESGTITKASEKLHKEEFREQKDGADDAKQLKEVHQWVQSAQPPPPNDVEHQWNINYLKDVDGTADSWMEESDERACYERVHRITVVEPDCNNNADNSQQQQGGTTTTITTSPYAPLTEVVVNRLRKTMSDRSNKNRVLADVNGCEITRACLRMLQPNK